MIEKEKIDFSKLNGLVPAVILDKTSNQILMLGFMNEESFDKTISTKRVTFFSRSKNRLWTKGETSGNFLNLINIDIDCDNDSLIIYVNPEGPACHTGAFSCFGIERSNLAFLNQLNKLIKDRKKELPEGSYTTRLFKEGADRIIQKVGEEAIETVIAAKNRDKVEIINEVSDLIYHLLVMLADQDIELEEIVDKLVERHNIKSSK
jgi:phosphoribosyl-ATP pyrophosphohydrolase/phosphoribosyl-AMP cyclohydrolase